MAAQNLPLNNTNLQTLLGLTVANITPYQVYCLVAELKRVPNARQADSLAGAGESTLGTLFPSSNPVIPA